MEGVGIWEARIDKGYRFTFEKTEDSLILRTIGQHDEGLGKK
jgi:putative component of toxin-antitoxin plasmid stabilization module